MASTTAKHIETLIALKDISRDREAREALNAAAQALSDLEYAYRKIDYGFQYGSFDFSILRPRARQFVEAEQ